MSTASRRVRRLRVRAPDAASARRAAIKLEDALRTASLPDAGGRLLFLRRLALGRIDPRAPPSALALRIEQAFALSGLCWVHGSTAEGQKADAVWFRDALDAHLSCASRVLRYESCTEWFWPRALPEVDVSAHRTTLLQELVRSLCALPEAAVAVPAWLAAVEAQGGFGALTAALDMPHAQALLRACGRRPPVAQEAWNEADRVTRSAASGVAAVVEPHPSKTPGAHRCAVAAEDEVVAALRELLPHSRGSPPQNERVQRVAPVRCSPQPQADAPLRGRAPSARLPMLRTRAGGLPFLLQAFARLGYPQWLASQPEWQAFAIERRVLARVLRQLHVEIKDPAWMLTERAEPETPPPSAFLAPPRWREGLGFNPVLRASAARKLEARVVQVWTIALRRWLRRYARIGLAELVLRPADIELTPTHLDLRYDPGLAELRLRRAGLDLDPGWLPWFGRVVIFRYERGAAP